MKHRESLLIPMYWVFFLLGLAQCFESVFLSEFKTYFNLSYSEQMAALFAKNIPFLCFSLLIGWMVQRLGYKQCVTISIFIFSAGTFLLVPGLMYRNYAYVLTAFFVIGIGFNFLIVAGNPLLASLGTKDGGSGRINVGSGLGALAQILAPLSIAFIIPATVVSVTDKIPFIRSIFLITSVVLFIAGCLFHLTKAGERQITDGRDTKTVKKTGIFQSDSLFAFMAIFLVLGVESGIFGLYRNYLEDRNVSGLTAHSSQRLYTLYFAMFALGRFVGSYVQKKISPAITLVFSAVIALLLVFVMMFADGNLAIVAITTIGFFISVLFPTLYGLSLERTSAEGGRLSGLLGMGFLGAAILPVAQGWLADRVGIQLSFSIAIVPYLFTIYFALHQHYVKRELVTVSKSLS